MRNNYLFISILTFLLPIAAWGQTTIDLSNGDYVITSGGEYIVSNYNGTNNISINTPDDVTLTIKDVTIQATEKSCINANNGQTVTLILEGKNTLTATNFCAITGSKKQLIIQGTGELIATVTAADAEAAAIGSRHKKNEICGDIVIKGGTITATGGNLSAGIGSCNYGICGNIIIYDGIITAGGKSGGIGSGQNGTCGDIIINGGFINATGLIGFDSRTQSTGTFSTGTDGHAFIITTKITANKDTNLSGIIIENNNSTFYGTQCILIADATIPENQQIEVKQGQTLIVDNCTLSLGTNATLTNSGGTILSVGGTINEGGVTATTGNKVTYHANYENSTETEIQYFTENTATIENLFTRQYYTFKGWYTDATSETDGAITEVSTTTDLYAHWEPNTFTLNSLSEQTLTYGTAMQDITLSKLLPENAVTNCGTITFSVSGDLPAGLTCENGVISGTPKTVNTTGTTVTITATAANTSTATQTATFTIAPAEPALAFGQTNGYEITYGEQAASIQATSDNSSGTVSYAYYTNQECTTGQTSTQPTDAGSYWVKATIAANGNYAEKSITTTYVIKRKDLTVTPTANQILFNGGNNANIAYTTDASGVEMTGSLAFEQNGSGHVITKGTLAIKNDADKKNYNLALSSTSVAITVYEEDAKDVEATATSGLNGNSWANSSLTLSAPTGFVFTNAEGTDSESGSKTFTAEGSYYLKQATGTSTTVYSHPLPIDVTNPAIPATPDDGSVTTTTATFTLEDALSGIASYKVTENNQEIAAYPEVKATTTGEKSLVYTYTGTAGTTHTLTFEVTDRAGNTNTSDITFTLKSNPNVPPGIPSYYDIYLEPNDSVRLSTTGTTVEEGYSFTLTAEVAEGYDPATLVVEYRKGRSGSWQALKAESSGKYRIRSVYSDIYIRASVRPLGDPTALETVGDGKSHIRTGGGIVYIETPVPQRVTVFTLDGRLIRHESLPAGDSRLYGLPAGLYVIRLQDGTTVKGLIRR